jgi:hypothetical protein
MIRHSANDGPTGGLSRREVLHGAAILAVSTTALAATPAAGDTTRLLQIENDEAMDRALPSLSNWGRWAPRTNSVR